MNNIQIRILAIDDNTAVLDDYVKVLVPKSQPDDMSDMEDALFGETLS